MKKRYSYLFFLIFAIIIYSCNPSIQSFTAFPLTVISKDSVKLNWKINGEPTLLFHEQVISGDTMPHFLDFTLVVQKDGKELSRMIQVIVLPKQSSDLIVFNTALNGDTLIATGIKNPERWGNHFEIQTIASASGRGLTVIHEGKTAYLDEKGSLSNIFAGTSVAGKWTFQTLLTTAEIANHSLAPETLHIKINIQSTNR